MTSSTTPIDGTGGSPGGWRSHIRPGVFYPAAALILSFVVAGIAMPSAAESGLAAVQSTIVTNAGWYYILLVAAFVGFSLYVGFSRFGRITLGKDGEQPEFSLRSWFAMLFSAGMGIGLIFWGVAEPLAHYQKPPERLGIDGGTVEAAQSSMHITYVHWGLHAWAIYVVVGLALAYAVHRRGRPLSMRWALEPLFGDRVKGVVGDVIDIAAVFGTLFGVATSLGLGVIQINAGLDFLGVVGSSVGVQIALIAVVTTLATISVVSGVERGIRLLSNVNILLAAALMVFVLLVGPTVFVLEEFVGSIGYYLQNVMRTTFATDAFYGNEFQSAWTTFYWGWWISWAPFVGVFIARISRGRTVREFVLGVLLVPTLVTMSWFSVLGGTALYRELFGEGGLEGLSSEQALFELLGGLPLSSIVSVLAIALIATFFITSSDSGSLVVDMLTSGGELDPPKSTRVFWASLEGAVAAVLLLTGGLVALQTAAIATALPFSFVMVLMLVATLKAFAQDPSMVRRRRALAAAGRLADAEHPPHDGHVHGHVDARPNGHGTAGALGSDDLPVDPREPEPTRG